MNASLDFGYPWWLNYGHLTLAAVMGGLMALGFRRRWSKLLLVFLGLVALWAGSVFLAIRFGVDINSVAPLPTENFLRSGTGRVLDLGAGTGRSSIMLLKARPKATLVALDLFGDSFDHHFGHGETPEQRLMTNLRSAGVADRVSIVKSDMRTLPFPNASFDGIVSAYAVDHLGSEGVTQTMAEAARVLKPGGEFLLVVINGRDPWLHYAFGPLLAHGRFRPSSWWAGQMQQAGLTIAEQGQRPTAFYVVGRRDASQ